MSKLLLGSLGILITLTIWQLLSLSPSHLIPGIQTLPRALADEYVSGNLSDSVLFSLYHTLVGVFAGAVCGVTLGFLCAVSDTTQKLLSPSFAILRPIPPIAWIPFAVIAFGSSHIAAIFIVASGVIWTTFLTTRSAVEAVPKELRELGYIFGYRSPVSLGIRILLPAAAPGIVTGIKTALGQGWTLVIAAELFGIPGIGQRMWEASGVLNMEVVVLYMFLIALIYVTTETVANYAERSLFKWR